MKLSEPFPVPLDASSSRSVQTTGLRIKTLMESLQLQGETWSDPGLVLV